MFSSAMFLRSDVWCWNIVYFFDGDSVSCGWVLMFLGVLLLVFFLFFVVLVNKFVDLFSMFRFIDFGRGVSGEFCVLYFDFLIIVVVLMIFLVIMLLFLCGFMNSLFIVCCLSGVMSGGLYS